MIILLVVADNVYYRLKNRVSNRKRGQVMAGNAMAKNAERERQRLSSDYADLSLSMASYRARHQYLTYPCMGVEDCMGQVGWNCFTHDTLCPAMNASVEDHGGDYCETCALDENANILRSCPAFSGRSFPWALPEVN